MKTRDFIHVPYYNYNIGILTSKQSVIVVIDIFWIFETKY